MSETRVILLYEKMRKLKQAVKLQVSLNQALMIESEKGIEPRNYYVKKESVKLTQTCPCRL